MNSELSNQNPNPLPDLDDCWENPGTFSRIIQEVWCGRMNHEVSILISEENSSWLMRSCCETMTNEFSFCFFFYKFDHWLFWHIQHQTEDCEEFRFLHVTLQSAQRLSSAQAFFVLPWKFPLPAVRWGMWASLMAGTWNKGVTVEGFLFLTEWKIQLFCRHQCELTHPAPSVSVNTQYRHNFSDKYYIYVYINIYIYE